MIGEIIVDPRVEQGVELFNAGDFFECHDVFEEYWNELRGSEKLCIQGLIQTAVGCYHALNGNFTGAASQFGKAQSKLELHSPRMFGLDDAGLVERIQAMKQSAEHCKDNPGLNFQVDLIPALRWISI